MQLWNLTNLKILRVTWHARDPGEPKSSKCFRLDFQAETKLMSGSTAVRPKNSLLRPRQGQPSCFSQAFSWLGEAHSN